MKLSLVVTALAVLLSLSLTAARAGLCDRDANYGVVRHALTHENEPTVLSSNAWHVVGPAATGDWAGHSGEWAYLASLDPFSGWTFEIPCIGDLAVMSVDYIHVGIDDLPVYSGQLIYDGQDGAGVRYWNVARPGFQQLEVPINRALTITSGQLAHAQPARPWKNDNGSYTWTLPGGVNSDFGPPTVIVANTGGGVITVVVAGGGTINGASSAVVGPNSAQAFVWVESFTGPGRWLTY